MFKKVIKFFFVLGIACFALLLMVYFGSRAYFTNLAQNKAEIIIEESAEKNLPDKKKELIEITRMVHKHFTPNEPTHHWQLRLRPYLTNSKLPSFIRYQDGVIETLIETGLCDNAARFLQFVLSQKGYKSVQWNMITNNRAHSILLVYLDGGQTAILDPMFGLIGYDKTEYDFLSPFEIRKRMRQGASLNNVFLMLDDGAETEFYEDFATVRMGALGEPLEIDADLPIVADDAVYLGVIDGNDSDVYNAAAANGMSPFWHYAGHKYDRSWVRTLKVHQDIRLEFILTSEVENNVITSDKKPEVDGKIMRWDLEKGDVLKFFDGQAKRSFKRMNSYINIDQIAIYPR